MPLAVTYCLGFAFYFHSNDVRNSFSNFCRKNVSFLQLTKTLLETLERQATREIQFSSAQW